MTALLLEIFPPGVKDCLKCPAGFYCPEGTNGPVPCPPGTFNPSDGQEEQVDCRECYAGKACTQAALRAPDVNCMEGSVTPSNPPPIIFFFLETCPVICNFAQSA